MDHGHLRIAITTNSLIQCDANFVQARQMVFYDVTRDASEFVDVVHFSKSGKRGPGGGGKKAGGGCVMDDMEDDDGTGRDPLVERVEAQEVAADNYLGRLSDNYDGRYDCPLGPDVRRGGAPTGDRPQRAAA